MSRSGCPSRGPSSAPSTHPRVRATRSPALAPQCLGKPRSVDVEMRAGSTARSS
jgi:hypothetical protein